MSSAGGLSRRRVQANVASDSPSPSTQLDPSSSSLGSSNEPNGFGHSHAGTAMEGGKKIAYDPRDLGNDDTTEGGKLPKLTILEEVLLLGLKDKQVSLCLYLVDGGVPWTLSSSSIATPLLSKLVHGAHHMLTIRDRDIFHFGTTISHMLFVDVSLSSSLYVDESPWFAILQDDVFPYPTAW